MKTLIVTVDPSFPPVSGADQRNFQNAKSASKIGPVLLCSFGKYERVEVAPQLSIEAIRGIEPAGIWAQDFDVHLPPEAAADLDRICREFKPDLVVLESLPAANLAGIARSHTRAVAIDFHNIESNLAYQALEDADSPAAISNIKQASDRLRSLEKRAFHAADAIWVCSQEDRQRLGEIEPARAERIFVVPNGIPNPESLPASERLPNLDGPPVILFVGHLHYPPNVDAAMALAELMPAIWKQLPDARLILAGRNPHSRVRNLEKAGRIEVYANPPSLSALYRQATMSVVPLRRGGGTRIKILEAMAWGLPVIASARGAEGLDLLDGIHLRIAETSDEFLTAIFSLRENPQHAISMRLSARNYVLQKFGFDAIGRAVSEAMDASLQLGLAK